MKIKNILMMMAVSRPVTIADELILTASIVRFSAAPLIRIIIATSVPYSPIKRTQAHTGTGVL